MARSSPMASRYQRRCIFLRL
uniref:Uncharacterized protein n=1 Tax=Anguilla anguilla TaxID=7936 RepID=A0A0E9PSZ8_ANGAN